MKQLHEVIKLIEAPIES